VYAVSARRTGRGEVDDAFDVEDREALKGTEKSHQRAAARRERRRSRAGEAEHPLVVDEPHRAVPLFAEQPQRVDHELRELRRENAADEPRIDRDLRGPLLGRHD
jgi:hypothetical protein